MELADVRRVFARQMLSIADAAEDQRLEDAFASVPREKFLGEGPWHILSHWSLNTFVDRDPSLIYQDVVVAIDEERGVNNGSPSLHARWMHLVAPKEGDTVAHIGAGNGYYSAILSELVGPDGQVIAVEYDEKSAQRAKVNLADRKNVSVIHGNGFDWPKDKTDIVYVNFASPRPAAAWIEKLRKGGRLAFPLGVPPPSRRSGGMNVNAVSFLVTRLNGDYAAAPIAPVSFVFTEGLAPEPKDKELKVLYKSLRNGGWDDVKSLIWRKPVDDARCWYVGPDWALSFDEISG